MKLDNEIKNDVFKNTFIAFAEKSMTKPFDQIMLQDIIECFQAYRVNSAPSDHKNDFSHARKWQNTVKLFEKQMMRHDIESYRFICK